MEKKTKILKQPELPLFLPHGWVKQIAEVLGVNRMTISRNVKKGHGEMFDRIVMAAAAKYGKKEEA